MTKDSQLTTARNIKGEALGWSGACRVVMVGGVQFAEDLFDAILARNRVVVHESQLRCSLQPQARSQLPPEKRRGALERTAARRPRLVVTKRGVEHPRQLEVGADLHPCQRHETDSGIVNLAGQQARELAPDLV